MKVIVVVPQSVQAFQLEVPDTVEDRSVKGSLHIRPGILELTSDEADFVLAKVPGVVVNKEREHAAVQEARAVADEALTTVPASVARSNADDDVLVNVADKPAPPMKSSKPSK